MGIPTIKKCCCLELKWGALIAVVVDFFFGSIVFFDADSERRSINIALYVLVLVYIAHIVCMILVLVSLCVPKKQLVAPYLITAIICVIVVVLFFIIVCIEMGELNILSLVLIIIKIILAVFLWIVVFSWYKKLAGSADT
ncbi:uncharacterized protein LOC6734276 [Drosophila simulans]|uniref:GD25783 n=1 Tax=Drosophila simulans TaxID=7240 RepID=B4QDZ6_DROSI|nr:uncharacterized protein LOC6734276 [Drosophila simulans]EDX06890.1 GD25783 [Drosophila simulans]KMY93436.1 uncharacterized protein Dsimw501_GD25783, isoform A [Drosophila simulans]